MSTTMLRTVDAEAAARADLAAGLNGQPLKRVRVNGAELAYVDEGTGQPVLFVHGGFVDLTIWQQQVPAVAKQYRAIAYSRRYAWPNDGIPDDVEGRQKSIEFDPAHSDRLAILTSHAPDAAPHRAESPGCWSQVPSRVDAGKLGPPASASGRATDQSASSAPTSDRVLWVWLQRMWPDGWRHHLRLVRPETVIRWHRKGWRLYWTWKSRTRLGRPHLTAEVRALIARMSRENPLWGSERIRGELLKLGLVVSNRSIRRYRRRLRPRDDHQRWRTFLANQLRGIWAADLFVVQTVSYRILYVFFLLRHDRREWIHFNVTASPSAAWIWRQVVEATPLGRQPRFLIHDRDADYGGDFDERLATLGVAGVRTPPRAPKANAIGERLVRTIRSECLDHVIVINESHLQHVLAEFADYYNHEQPHRSLGLRSPIEAVPQPSGRVVSRPVLGGLHQAYARAA